MKEIFRGILAVVIFVSAIAFILARSYAHIPEGYVLLSQKSIDSINAIASSIPDTVEKRDTVWPDPKVKWFPYNIYLKDTTHKDTIRNSEIEIYVSDTIDYDEYSVNGKIGYKLLSPKTIIDTIWTTKKVPVLIQSPEKKWFLTGGVGVNRFIISGEFGYSFKNRTYSFEIEHFENINFFKIKTGIKF